MSVDVIARWVSTIVDPPIPVIISNPNAPAPSGDYLVVSFVSDTGGCYPIVDVGPSGEDDVAVYTADNDTLLSTDISAFSARGADILNDIKNHASLPPFDADKPIMYDCGVIRGPAFFNDCGFTPRYVCEYSFRTGHVTQATDVRVKRINVVGYLDGAPIEIDEALSTPTQPATDGAILLSTSGAWLLSADGATLTSI